MRRSEKNRQKYKHVHPAIYSPKAKYEKSATNHIIYKDGKEYVSKIIPCIYCNNRIDFTDYDISETVLETDKVIKKDDYGHIFEFLILYLKGYITCPKCNKPVLVKRLHMNTLNMKVLKSIFN